MGEQEDLARLNTLSAAEKMILALRGDRAVRIKLAQDVSTPVWTAVLASPQTSELDVELISQLRDVQPGVLKEIGKNRQWTERYKVCLNLAMNPTTPEETALALLARLSREDLKRVSDNQEVADRIRDEAQHLREVR